jgi:hypothetical protein
MSADPTTFQSLLHPYPSPSQSESIVSTRGVPDASLTRVKEYIKAPTDQEEFFTRHCVAPCVIRNHPSSIFSKEQLAEINKLFDQGRWKYDPGNPLLALLGWYRPSSPNMNELDSYPDFAKRGKEAVREHTKAEAKFKKQKAAAEEKKRNHIPLTEDETIVLDSDPPVLSDFLPRDTRTYKVSLHEASD